ncbi:remorin-like isoform X2 [Asparagus officinalis]|uniref:remorin-like isoform X2 n=1 Tax=Asparagus officinalis TaxID=4686 RepID=UPI00098DFC15|nr:remorin-like isoform X2 [Asparagus officinalis]
MENQEASMDVHACKQNVFLRIEDHAYKHSRVTVSYGNKQCANGYSTDKYLNDTGSKRAGSRKEMTPGSPKASSVERFPTSSFGNRTQDGYPVMKSKAEEKADAWESKRMIKIKDRYDKMMSVIKEWENEKKEKAKNRLEKKQIKSEEKRVRALQKYQDEISRIEKVAGKARELAEERKRSDEAKARAKAEKIRSTGKTPRTCC